jgi:Kef-type K+ transport system membrane component KefB
MAVEGALFDIVVLLLAAKAAAELSHRLRIPAVVGEILAGIAIGPSLLGLVLESEVLAVLSELGVILLLVEVGMQVDLLELVKVGRAAVFVAVVGVVVPFVTGYLAGSWLGLPTDAAIFAGAALTATSVGITARVFGELGTLSSPEARTVLGAAIADDVMGLFILTLVTSSVAGGSVSTGGAVGVVVMGLLALGGSALGGAWVAPRIFDHLHRWARSPGALVAISFAFVLIFGSVADAAGLAPVIGAFVAGLALARSTVSDRIHRELAPLGHLLVPVFFLQIGVQMRVGEVANGASLRVAAMLFVVAVAGKLVSGIGAVGARGDKLTIGLGMLPRGEVGLIFATIGLHQGVIGQGVYGALLVVVLASTLLSPLLLRWRVASRTRKAIVPAARPDRKRSHGLTTEGDVVDLVGSPPAARGLHIALEAARAVTSGKRPTARLMDWLGNLPGSNLGWDGRASGMFCDLLRHGNERSWRLLHSSGLLERTLPELARAIRTRGADPLELDPSGPFRWPILDRLHDVIGDDPQATSVAQQLRRPESLYVAALVLSVAGEGAAGVRLGRRLAGRLALGAGAEQEIASLVQDASVLRSALRRNDFLEEEPVMDLTRRLRSLETVRAAYLVNLSLGRLEDVERQRLDALFSLTCSVLGSGAGFAGRADNHAERRSNQTAALIGDDSVGAPRDRRRSREGPLRADPT